MATAIFRFWWQGWIDRLFVVPTHFFKLPGFEWVLPLGATGMYLVFGILFVLAVCIALGWYFRLSVLVFGVLFAYVELVDLTNYLNHYYLIVLLCFWWLIVPAHGAGSLDVRRRPTTARSTVPAWMIYGFMFQLGLVYFFAGFAKLNPDWLFRAMPLAVWLPEHADLPLLGPLLAWPLTAFLFSWAGAIYDLTIPFFLLFAKTRPWAYGAVVVFHAITGMLFNIGWFPWIMIFFTTIFFSPEWHQGLLNRVGLRLPQGTGAPGRKMHPGLGLILLAFISFQIFLPLRFLAYPGNVLWHEQGYRFAWRVMLVEKHGHATFRVKDPVTGRSSLVHNRDFLTDFQEKQMAIQPEFIVQFARMIEQHYQKTYDIKDPQVYVESYVALNGRASQAFIDPNIDLTEVPLDWNQKNWVLPFKDKP